VRRQYGVVSGVFFVYGVDNKEEEGEGEGKGGRRRRTGRICCVGQGMEIESLRRLDGAIYVERRGHCGGPWFLCMMQDVYFCAIFCAHGRGAQGGDHSIANQQKCAFVFTRLALRDFVKYLSNL
jgi:hypothetical protein